jgi:hypothetical protein
LVDGAGFERFDALVSIPQSAFAPRGLCSWGQVLVVAWSSGRQAVSMMSSILLSLGSSVQEFVSEQDDGHAGDQRWDGR